MEPFASRINNDGTAIGIVRASACLVCFETRSTSCRRARGSGRRVQINRNRFEGRKRAENCVTKIIDGDRF